MRSSSKYLCVRSRGADWAIYEAFKTAAIPNYNPYRPDEAKSTDASVQGVELAARYAVASASAMSISAVLTNPIEVVRTRWQTSGGDPNRPPTLLAMVREMNRQAGWKAFMRGAVVRGLYYVGSCAAIIAYADRNL